MLNIEHLQKLAYERSKIWATFLEKVCKNETLEEFHLDDLDNFIKEECNENDMSDLASMEEDECDDYVVDNEVLSNVSNTMRLSLMFNNKTMAIPQEHSNEESEMIDIFNQTLPIINENNRQLKESGLDKILNSFDKKKIEDKVGKWLSRHNSLFGGDNTLLGSDVQMKITDERHLTNDACRRKNIAYQEESNVSDDSLQSGETARYIRSSRAGATKSSVTTMIKTFRMAKTSRKMLYEKYEFEKDDDYHLKAIRRRRKVAGKQEFHKNYDTSLLQSASKRDIKSMGLQNKRRKILRKRARSKSCSTVDTSSDSDLSYEDNDRFSHKNIKSCYSRYHCFKNKCIKYPPSTTKKKLSKGCEIIMSSSSRNRMYYYSHAHSKSFSTSSSSNSFSALRKRRRRIKKNSRFSNDDRPSKRESECHCCNEKTLCAEYKHVADTSTDDWYVENYPSVSNRKAFKTNSIENDTLPAISGTVKEDSKSQAKIKSDKVKSTTKQEKLNTENISTPKYKLSLTKNIPKEIIVIESDTEIDENLGGVNHKETHVNISKASLRKFSKNQNELNKITHTKGNKNKNVTKSIDANDIKLVKEKNKVKNKNLLEDNSISNNTDTKKIKNKNSLKNSKNESFFTTQSICNSTALQKEGVAYDRQINEKLHIEADKEKGSTKEIRIRLKNINTEILPITSTISQGKGQSTTMISNALCSSEINSTLIQTQNDITSRKGGNNEIDIDDDNSDCALVTSTTHHESSFLNSYCNIDQKGILIYAPDKQNGTSSDYFTVTKDHLSKIIGEKQSEKFLKYYCGPKRFNINSAIYFIPPAMREISTSNSDDDDALDNMGKYGDLYEVYFSDAK